MTGSWILLLWPVAAGAAAFATFLLSAYLYPARRSGYVHPSRQHDSTTAAE